jgi:8-amino-7-oxononanoate synthase
LLAFASNDYLGLATHPALVAASTTAARDAGSGAGSARLVTGDLPAHRQLEATIADFLETPAALLFSTGYQANLGVVTALAGKNDLIVSDAANHASLIDGCRLSRATVCIYPHADAAAAHAALTTPGPYRRRFLLTESLFSMDGDAAPLSLLATAATAAGATLIVDESHALGVLGPGGRGLCADAGITPDVLIGTLGKAFGSFGGFVAGARVLRDFLINRARTFIFTTALPPAVAAAATAGVILAAGPEGSERRQRLIAHVTALAESLAAAGLIAKLPAGAILPVVVGTDTSALTAAAALADHGFFVPAIRPPTVPEGAARLRITLSADHTADEVSSLATVLCQVLAR